VLGSGINGDVHMAVSKSTGAVHAVKAFKLHGVGAQTRKELFTECEIFLTMDHPHVARLVDVYEDGRCLHLVMECMGGGELFDRVSQRRVFTQKDASTALRQMLLAVNYIHSHNVVHRDLKLENFLYESPDSSHLKLIDFGFSKVWKPNTRMAQSCGTLGYIAPEVLEGNYGSECDMWSLGVVAFILLSGYMPFSGSERMQVSNIRAGKYSWRDDKWAVVSEEGQAFVRSLLAKDPQARLTAEQALHHEFITMHEATGPEPAPHVDTGVVQALCEFASASAFRKTAMSMMAWSLTNEERSKVRDAFLEIDKDHQGTISLMELKEVLTTKFTLTDEAVKPIFEAMDTSCDDEIHYSEFLAAMVSTRIALHDELLLSTFKRFDVDNSGQITIDNLRQVLGRTHDGDELEELLHEVDTGGDGQISYEEFITYLKGGGSQKHADAAVKIIESELESSPRPRLRRPLSEKRAGEAVYEEDDGPHSQWWCFDGRGRRAAVEGTSPAPLRPRWQFDAAGLKQTFLQCVCVREALPDR